MASASNLTLDEAASSASVSASAEEGRGGEGKGGDSATRCMSSRLGSVSSPSSRMQC